MNSVAEEILSYFGMKDYMNLNDDELAHIGMPRRSGRYPYGSGQSPYQHGRDFLGRIKEMKNSGFTYTDPETGEKYTGEKAIYKSMGLTSSQYRRQVSWASYETRLENVETAKRQTREGKTPTEIGKMMGVNESTVRSWLDKGAEGRMHKAMETVDLLRKEVDEKGMIDVGANVNRELGISKERLELALDYLQKAEGYPVYGGGIKQPTNPGQQTNQKVLCIPGTKPGEIYDFARVKTIKDYISRDGGETFEKKFYYPESLDSKRLKILLKDEIGPDGETGEAKDGLIQIRPGVPDLSLGESKYSQVRILVDGDKYMKGMAVYSDNMPDGVDVVFNTNKTSYDKALKGIKKDDPENPFGSLIKDADQGGQYWYDADTGQRCSATDPNVKNKKLGLINKRADEGDWDDWANAVPSQFLGKQSIDLAQKQLNLAKADKQAEYDEICSINNPTIKKHLLEKFADGCDSAAVHLKAAALPGQKYHVIIPVNTLKDDEVYAPGYKDGTKLALIRYPHGGTFEIPILKVNNKHKPASDIIGKDTIDALCINKKNADLLSGADFDGDTVMAVPTHNGKIKIQNKDPLPDLVGFDNKLEYGGEMRKGPDGKEHYFRNGFEYPIMKNTQKEMGVISNLITDMTLLGAPDAQIAKAVKHSMVVIDAEKHKLDYKASEIDNDIASLKKEWQIRIDPVTGEEHRGGAATLLSRSKGQYSVDKRQGSYKVNMPGEKHYDPTRPDGSKLWKAADDLYYPDRKYDKDTGLMTIRTADGKKLTYNVKDKAEYERYNPVKNVNKETGEVTYTNKAGDIAYYVKTRTQRSTNMAETDDARTLISKMRHPMEVVYADYANSMKAMANQARVEMKTTVDIPYSAQAKATYQNEFNSLMTKLNDALLNTTRERAALRLANAEIKQITEANPNMKKEDVRKINQRAVTKYRNEVGSIKRHDRNIDITDREWEAIQAGAISPSNLKKILNNSDIDKLRERATPKTRNSLSPAKVSQIQAKVASGYTLAQIADQLGVSTSTVSKYLKGAK